MNIGVKGNRNKRRPQKKKKHNLTHRDACFSLAEAKGTRYVEMPLGSAWISRGSLGHADVVTVKPSYTKFNIDIYEVKVTRSDFLQDIKKGKYKRYLPFSNRLYFAVLDGIAQKDEIPEGIGLIKYGEKGWHTIKAAKKREIEHMEQMLMALAFSNGRIYQQRRLDISRNGYGIRTVQKSRLKGFGKKIKDMILNYSNLELKFSNLLYDASEKIPFKSEEEREMFIKKWEKKSYIRDW